MTQRVIALATALVVLTASAPLRAELPQLSVDLHNHLFMKIALGWLFEGAFDGPLRASSWDDRLSSKINPASLQASGIGIQVVALTAHAVPGLDMRTSVRLQIAEARRFTEQHPDWVIARSSEQARSQLAAGRRVLVLALEGASGVLESEEDLAEFVDELGVRIVTPLHLVDDRFGGVATLDGFQRLANPLGVAHGLLSPECGHGALPHNPKGLKPPGRALLTALLRRGVWIDLAHASDAALVEMLPMVKAAGQPLLFTHGTLRRHRPAERSLSDHLLSEIAASRGVVGLLPSEDYLGGAHASPDLCPRGCSPERCQQGVHRLAAAYRDIARVVGPEAVMLGADFNGGMRHLRPSCGTGTSLDEEAGLWHVGQTGEVWSALASVGAPVPQLGRTLAHFLGAWSQVRPVAPGNADGGLPSRAEVEGPSLRGGIGAGLSSAEPGGVGVLFRAALAVRKDLGQNELAEPEIYFASAAVEAALSGEGSLAHLRLSAAPVGVRARELDTFVAGEAIGVTFARHTALDQHTMLRLALARGAFGSTPRSLTEPGVVQPFLEADVELVGLMAVERASTRELDHGFHVATAAARVGVVLGPPSSVSLRLHGGLGADLGVDEAGYLSNVELLGGLTGRAGEHFELFALGSWLGFRQSAGDRWAAVPWLRAGLGASF